VTNIGTLAGGGWTAAMARCPKHMAHGPCAGVSAAGACEVPGVGRCSYLDVPDRDWPYPGVPVPAARAGARPPQAAEFLAVAATRPVVVADLVAPPLSADGLRSSAAELAGACDACLTGDHGGARVQFPPSYRARLLAGEGIPSWAGINGRDRNRAAIEGEIAACADAGVVGLHCVTGDHPGTGHRPDARPVFDLDCIGVIERARPSGVLCSAAHAPAAPPTRHRLPRLLAKISAGADAVFVDHCGGPGPLGDAVAELRATGFGGLVLACVPVVTSPATAAIIASFAGERLPRGYLDAIVSARDPQAAGIAAAADLAGAMLAWPGVDGVNLSAGAPAGQERDAARAVAEAGRRVLGARAPVRAP
jgi:5,10-methylenetetrahydrofolate reductase